MKLQEYYASKACNEAGLLNPKIEINHINGSTFINGKEHGLVFPLSFVNYCKSVWSSRIQESYFKGFITKKRDWVRVYDNVTESKRGRNKDLKYSLDKEYYESLGRTKFALTPTGDCPWSYRMFEAMMCGSIPVLGDDDVDVFAGDYKVYRHSDIKEYRLDYAEYNYKQVCNNILL